MFHHGIRGLQAKHNLAIPQPPHSLDLALADILLFPRIESAHKAHHFDGIDDIQTAVKTTPIEDSSRSYREYIGTRKYILLYHNSWIIDLQLKS